MKVYHVILLIGVMALCYIASAITLANYEESKAILGYHFWALNITEKLAYIFLRLIASFPLGIYNWFTDYLMFLNFLLIVPNAFFIRYIYNKHKST